MSGRPIKMKDLIPVRFTLIKDSDDKRSLIVKDNDRYMCAVTSDVLSNSVRYDTMSLSVAGVDKSQY